MKPRPDAGLEAALEQRTRKLDQERQALALREQALHEQVELLGVAENRVRMVLRQIDAAQRPIPGGTLAVALLGDLERLLQWCEAQVAIQSERVQLAREEANTARGVVAAAHQQVRALELVLEARAAERAEKQRRNEIRLADETAARVHSRRAVSR